MRKWGSKKHLTAAGVAAAIAVAAAVMSGASGVSGLFEPKNFSRFQNHKNSDEYDYVAGEGEDADLADQNKNGEDGSGSGNGNSGNGNNQGNHSSDPSGDSDNNQNSGDKNDNSNGGGGTQNPSDDNKESETPATSDNGKDPDETETPSTGETETPPTKDNTETEVTSNWADDQLKPKDQVVTEYGVLTGLSGEQFPGYGFKAAVKCRRLRDIKKYFYGDLCEKQQFHQSFRDAQHHDRTAWKCIPA
jgi:hypothetical protein